MVTKINNITVYVHNLKSALSFYVDTLGFVIDTDILIEPKVRWALVSPPNQPDLRLMLVPVEEGVIFKGKQVKKMRELMQQEIFSYGVLKCHNLIATYKLLEAKGVPFIMKPGVGFLGQFEAAFLDDSGNWFRLTEDNEAV